ncbi:MAG: hypothetical protein AB1Z98_06320, partial [Nannocystaceae bacterium]
MPTRALDGAWAGLWSLLVLCAWLVGGGRARALQPGEDPARAEAEAEIMEPGEDPAAEPLPEPEPLAPEPSELDGDLDHGLDPGDEGYPEPAEPGTDEPFAEPSDGRGAAVDLTDALGPVEAAIDGLESLPGVTVSDRFRTVDALRGETLTAVLGEVDGGLLQYVLRKVADDGYQLLLEPLGPRSFRLIALRSRPGQARGVLLVNVDSLELEGSTRTGESLELLRRRLTLPAGGVLPVGFTDQLAAVGYRAAFQAAGPGSIVVNVRPGRVIRRVRVRGQLPLSEREIRRALSQDARPGALAPGQCVPPRQARARRNRSVVTEVDGGRRDGTGSTGQRRSLICEEGDLACDAWERTELDRLQRFMFDNGYLKGAVSLSLWCGRNGQEVDLHVTLRKGPAYRVGSMAVTGNLTTQDQRWIRRVFRPKMSPLLPIPRRVTRKHIEQSKERIATEYAEPRTSPGSGTRRGLRLPYPGVRIDTNFDRIEPGDLPEGRKLPLEV